MGMCWICGNHGLHFCLNKYHYSDWNIWGCRGNQMWDIRQEGLWTVACSKYCQGCWMLCIAPCVCARYCIGRVTTSAKNFWENNGMALRILVTILTVFWILPFVLALVFGLLCGIMQAGSAADEQYVRCWEIVCRRVQFIHKRGRQSCPARWCCCFCGGDKLCYRECVGKCGACWGCGYDECMQMFIKPVEMDAMPYDEDVVRRVQAAKGVPVIKGTTYEIVKN